MKSFSTLLASITLAFVMASTTGRASAVTITDLERNVVASRDLNQVLKPVLATFPGSADTGAVLSVVDTASDTLPVDTLYSDAVSMDGGILTLVPRKSTISTVTPERRGGDGGESGEDNGNGNDNRNQNQNNNLNQNQNENVNINVNNNNNNNMGNGNGGGNGYHNGGMYNGDGNGMGNGRHNGLYNGNGYGGYNGGNGRGYRNGYNGGRGGYRGNGNGNSYGHHEGSW